MKKNFKALAIRIEDDIGESPDAQRDFEQPRRIGTLPDSDDDKHNRPEGIGNVVEFQEFLMQEDKDSAHRYSTFESSNLQQTHLKASKFLQSPLSSQGNPRTIHQTIGIVAKKEGKQGLRRDFLIQIPEEAAVKEGCYQQPRKQVRQPPAPSNKKSNKTSKFTFPVQQQELITKDVYQEEQRRRDDNQQLLRSFQKERQEFYRQKSRYQKALMVKEGQIEMLQRMLTGRIGEQPWNPQLCQRYQAIVIEKDLQIAELLEKIGELGQQLACRTEELRQSKNQLSKITNTNESLLHQLYIAEKRESAAKVTEQLYQNRKLLTPTARRWPQDWKKDDNRFSGYHQLQRRLENLKHSRMEYEFQSRSRGQEGKRGEERTRIKSEMGLHQTAKLNLGNFNKSSINDYSLGFNL